MSDKPEHQANTKPDEPAERAWREAIAEGQVRQERERRRKEQTDAV